ncbi:hypothetical protein M5689_002890 [Euphorbia peplus]|nr:hypothetical protein M5689_002890 [Euphorbia peplus]
MDKKEESKEAAEDLARESLIGISNTLPDKVEKPDVDNGCVVADNDEADKYRSELISISYSQSGDITLGKTCA